MKTIYLIRHAAPFVEIANYSEQNQILWSEINQNMILSSKGEENAKKLCSVPELKHVDEIFASNSARAIGTAKYLAASNNLKIRLDARINEREFGIKYLKELPSNFTQLSFENKNFKIGTGESLNEVDYRFQTFLNDLLTSEHNNFAIVIHGIILLSYLKTVCDHFEFDGKDFDIRFHNRIILKGTPLNPSIYKIEFDNQQQIKNIESIKC